MCGAQESGVQVYKSTGGVSKAGENISGGTVKAISGV